MTRLGRYRAGRWRSVDQTEIRQGMERGASRGTIRRGVWVATAVLTLAAAAPLLLAAHYHALGVPRSDDWSYLLVQFRFARHGAISLNNWVSMTLVGQIVLGAPIAIVSHESITAMQYFTVAMGVAGLFGVIRLGRQLRLSPWQGTFVAMTVAAGPLWGPLAVSYMTDIPSFTLGMLSLAAGVEAVRRRDVSLPLIALSFALGYVAFAIRQYGIVAPLAVAITAIWVLADRRDTKRLRSVAVMVGVLLFASGALFVWWRGLPQSLALTPAFPTFHSTRNLALKGTNLFRLLGLLTAPAIIMAGPVHTVRRAWRAAPRSTALVLGLGALLMAGMYLHVQARPFVGNYVARDGVLSTDVLEGARPRVVPTAVFDLLVLFASIGAVLLLAALIPATVSVTRPVRARALHPADPALVVVGLAFAGYSVAYAAALATGLPLYDRYVLPLVPLGGLAVLRTAFRTEHAAQPATAGAPAQRPVPAPGRLAGAAVALVALAVVGLAFTADSASFDGTRWAVATAATRHGYTALQVDGGFEWDSYHLGFAPSTSRPPNSGTRTRAVDPRERRVHYCVKVRVGPAPAGSTLVASAPFRAPSHGTTPIVAVETRTCVPSG